jgi:two-component system, probable response regulator PhcQ
MSLGPVEGGRPLAILVVDDDPLVLSAVRRVLAADGHRIFQTTDPTAVLAMIAREDIDILITDLDMPEMSGVDLAALVRHKHPHVVRILLTGAASLGSALHAINEGEVFRYLTKPWESQALRGVIREAGARVRELGRLSNATAVTERRAQLLRALEKAFPGITRIPRVGEVYVVNSQSLPRALGHFDAEALWALWR